MSVPVVFSGALEGHKNWVTSLDYQEEHQVMISGSRDKKIIYWDMDEHPDGVPGVPKKMLTGHSHYVSSIEFSTNGLYAISSSWDKTLRLWNIKEGTSTLFQGHSGDCLCALIEDNSLIVSGSRDQTIRVWNVAGQCQQVLGPDQHKGWVTCMGFLPRSEGAPLLVAGTWSGRLIIWEPKDTTFVFRGYLPGHTAPITSLCCAPDGSLVASGSKNGQVLVHDPSTGEITHSFSVSESAEVRGLSFFVEHFWLAVATSDGIEGYDLSKAVRFFSRRLLEDGDSIGETRFHFDPGCAKPVCIRCISDDRVLVGAQDGRIYTYTVSASSDE